MVSGALVICMYGCGTISDYKAVGPWAGTWLVEIPYKSGKGCRYERMSSFYLDLLT
jgi:hypothetical protein